MAHAGMSTAPETTTQGQSCSRYKLAIYAHLTGCLHIFRLFIVCREGRGLGFVEFTSPRDAEDAKYGMDRSVLDGKEVSPT